ncbi:MAG TPA: DNA double-strand break repair nuclease NurA, partial [Chloroflexota bacterium]
MPLDLAALARQTRLAADETAGRESELAARVDEAAARLRSLAWDEVAARVEGRRNRPWLAGVPLEPMAAGHPAPPEPASYTVVSTDGSHLDHDHHGPLPCWLINVGAVAIRYGGEPAAHLETRSWLGYRPGDLHFVHGDYRLRVQGQLLNVRRQVAEIEALAELCEAYPGAVALVDGTLVLTSISRSIQEEPSYFLKEYLALLDRIRASGAILASYISRPSSSEATSALRIGVCPLEECDRRCRLGELADRACARLADVLDRGLFGATEPTPGARTGLWRSTWPTSEQHYGDHRVHFFYLDAGLELARVEVPGWVASSRPLMERLQAVLVAQCARG